MKLRSSFALAALITATAAAQTTPGTTQKRTTRHTSSSTASKSGASKATAAKLAAAAPEVNPADNPPNVPKVEGTPKPLYALRYIDTQVGTGELSKQRQYYTVRYTGWLTDGTKFDSSDDHPGAAPIVFPYGARRVIPGWDTGFEGMHVGGKRRLYVPYQLAYGESGRPPVIPAKADLIFDVELVAQSDSPPQENPAPTAPPAPRPGATPTQPSTANPAQSPPEPKSTPEPSTSKPPSPPPATSPSGGNPPQNTPNP